LKKNRDEAQKRLDSYAQKGIIVKDPGVVNVNTQVLFKADVLVAKQELKDFLTWFENVLVRDPYQDENPVSREAKTTEIQVAQRDARDLLRRVQPILLKSRDLELTKLVETISKRLEPAETC